MKGARVVGARRHGVVAFVQMSHMMRVVALHAATNHVRSQAHLHRHLRLEQERPQRLRASQAAKAETGTCNRMKSQAKDLEKSVAHVKDMC